MNDKKTKVAELYDIIDQQTKGIGGHLLPSEVILGSMVEAIQSADFKQAPDGRKALVFNEVSAQTFLLVLESMTVIYESARFQEFGRVLNERVESKGATEKARYEAFKKAMNDIPDNDDNKTIGFGG